MILFIWVCEKGKSLHTKPSLSSTVLNNMNWLKKIIENIELFAAACLSNCSGSSTYLKSTPCTPRQASLTQNLPMLRGLHSVALNSHKIWIVNSWVLPVSWGVYSDEASKASKKKSKDPSLAIRPRAQPVSCPQIVALFPSQTRESPSKTHTRNGAWQGLHLHLCPALSGRGTVAQTRQYAGHYTVGPARCQDVSLCFEFTQLTTNRGCDMPGVTAWP